MSLRLIGCKGLQSLGYIITKVMFNVDDLTEWKPVVHIVSFDSFSL